MALDALKRRFLSFTFLVSCISKSLLIIIIIILIIIIIIVLMMIIKIVIIILIVILILNKGVYITKMVY